VAGAVEVGAEVEVEVEVALRGREGEVVIGGMEVQYSHRRGVLGEGTEDPRVRGHKRQVRGCEWGPEIHRAVEEVSRHPKIPKVLALEAALCFNQTNQTSRDTWNQ